MANAEPIFDEMMPFGRRPEAMPMPPTRELGPTEDVLIDANKPFIDNEFEIVGGEGQASLIAKIDAGAKAFQVMTSPGANNRTNIYVIDETYSPQERKGYVGLKPGDSVILGRRHERAKFDYPSTTSGDHFRLTYEDDGLRVYNLNPTNRTRITANFIDEPEAVPLRAAMRLIFDNRTDMAERRARRSPNYQPPDEQAPYGYHDGLPMIGRRSQKVNGGVYLGGSAREAIVVDGDSKALRNVYEDLPKELRRSFKANETWPIELVLNKIMLAVQRAMPYNAPVTEMLSSEYKDDGHIDLSRYVEAKGGVCRHQGLAAALMGENLIDDGFLSGTVGVERNTVPDMGGTHAWGIYKPPHSKPKDWIVIDPAQSFVGTKAQAEAQGRWDYSLPSDDYSDGSSNR
jgi:hypothetical protein